MQSSLENFFHHHILCLQTPAGHGSSAFGLIFILCVVGGAALVVALAEAIQERDKFSLSFLAGVVAAILFFCCEVIYPVINSESKNLATALVTALNSPDTKIVDAKADEYGRISATLLLVPTKEAVILGKPVALVSPEIRIDLSPALIELLQKNDATIAGIPIGKSLASVAVMK